MSQDRVNIINKAFEKFDNDGSGVVEVSDMKLVYNAREHEKYKNGEWTEEQVWQNSISTEFYHERIY